MTEEEDKNQLRQLGVYITIPFVLAVPPVLGWLAGQWLDEKMGSGPYMMYLLIVLGFAAGFREVYRIIKRFGDAP